MNREKITTLEQLLEAVHKEIKHINDRLNLFSVPETSDLVDICTKKFGVIPFTVPKLLELLVKSSMLFSFTIVEEDRRKKIKKVKGHIVADRKIIAEIRFIFENELAGLFSQEYALKYTPENAVTNFMPRAAKFNNTVIGRTGNTAVMAAHFESVISRKRFYYTDDKIDKKLRETVFNSEPLSFFIPDNNEKETQRKLEGNHNDSRKSISEFMNFSGKNSIERTLTVYGTEFYTRVCFRNYNFSGIIKIINDGFIPEKKELVKIKNLLQELRTNSDSDINLQNYAPEINNLQKLINQKIKESDG